MKKFNHLIITVGLALTTSAWAGGPVTDPSCITDGASLNQAHSLSSPSFDPYSYLIPSDIDAQRMEFSSAYSIDLKPLYSDDMSRYQFKTVDNRGMGAGYSSPYLWEAGRGPGYTGSPSGFLPSQMDGRSFSPVPMGR